ncbi:MAG: 30S ribosomal protein S6 [Ignavibacteriales bacterium CG18_big_fil_WC_8_21_14_2_50_31_20]|nr:MAG: 30S ribosomal protein S6 [Ignavibacteriales bacterium CG18_big_fil_WC_8_21_14_2_50_31_20]
MKTNHYESVIIFNATLEDQQIDSILTSIEEQMSANGVEITDIEKWGRKRLAYPIKKGKSGYYIIYRFTSPREYITKFERTLRLDENVIRFLTIKLELKDLEYLEKRKSEVQEEVVENEVTILEAEPVVDDIIEETETNDSEE